MHKLVIILQSMLVLLVLQTPTVSAQTETDVEQTQPVKRILKKKKTKKKRKKPANAQEMASAEAANAAASAMFPDWPAPGFDWSIRPLIAASQTTATSETGERKLTTVELGLGLGLSGIPIVSGNSGLYLEPSAGYVFGAVSTTVADAEGKEVPDRYTYTRRYVNLDTVLLAKFYRHTLGIARGQKEINDKEDKYPNVESFQIKNDFGFLIYSWISAHYTHRYLRAYGGGFEFGKPSYAEQDNWLHLDLSASILDFHLDFGPGFTLAEDYAIDEAGKHFSVAKGRTDYILALSSMHLFWKVGFSAHAKYVYASTEEDLGSNARTKLPTEGLYTPTSVAMPEDSLIAATFLGLTDVFMGMGFGWYHNLQILNMSEKNDKEKQTTKDDGFGFTFNTEI